MTKATNNSKNDKALLWAYQRHAKGYDVLDDSAINIKNSKSLQWAHIRYDAVDAIDQLQGFGLDGAVINALTAEETRPRTLALKGGTLVLLRAINTNHDADPEDMISLRIWFTEHFIITARKQGRMLLSVEDMRLAFDSPNPPNKVGDFIVILVEKIADRIGEAVYSIDENLSQFEESIAKGAYGETRLRLALTRRQTASIRRYLAPQRDALEALNRMQGVLTDNDVFAIRQQTDRTTRYLEDLDLARERAIFLQEELRNQIAEQQNKRMYVLSIVTAIFLPLSFLTGVFGVNVAGLPGTENINAFYYLATGMFLLALVILVVMYWRRWL